MAISPGTASTLERPLFPSMNDSTVTVAVLLGLPKEDADEVIAAAQKKRAI